MNVQMGVWRMTDDGPLRLEPSPLEREQRLEDMVAGDPGMIGTELLVIGRQVRTAYGGYADLLALDADGRVHVIELKRDRTPRDVVAQVLDYGSWAQDLSFEDIERIYLDRHDDETSLDDAFSKRFGCPLPDVVNDEQQFTVIASELDPTSDRIIRFLAESYGVPVNAVFFRHFTDDGRDYLARTWLLDPQPTEGPAGRSSRSKRPRWNGQDFYVMLGKKDDPDDLRWRWASQYGFIASFGASKHWKRLLTLKQGQRIFAYVAQAGYVGIARVTGEMIPARDAEVEIDGRLQPLLDQPGLTPAWKEKAASDNPEETVKVVEVEWLARKSSLDEAVWEKGLFKTQHTICKLRNERTVKTVESEFGLDTST